MKVYYKVLVFFFRFISYFTFFYTILSKVSHIKQNKILVRIFDAPIYLHIYLTYLLIVLNSSS